MRRFIVDAHPKDMVELIGPKGEENVLITTDKASRTMFSCHTDTVHWKDGYQKVWYDHPGAMIYTDQNQHGNDCLGADDGAGVWIMLNMIAANVPGKYMFHRGEEKGGIGSRWIARERKEWLRANFDRAIAFDRKATHSIISHQGGVRGCSTEFVDALAAELNRLDDSFMYTGDETGTFTDTKSYFSYIPECTNISVGYYDQHGSSERLDVNHIRRLLSVALLLDWSKLPTKREAKEETYQYSYTGHYNRRGGYRDYQHRGAGFGGIDDPLDYDDYGYPYAGGVRQSGHVHQPDGGIYRSPQTVFENAKPGDIAIIGGKRYRHEVMPECVMWVANKRWVPAPLESNEPPRRIPNDPSETQLLDAVSKMTSAEIAKCDPVVLESYICLGDSADVADKIIALAKHAVRIDRRTKNFQGEIAKAGRVVAAIARSASTSKDPRAEFDRILGTVANQLLILSGLANSSKGDSNESQPTRTAGDEPAGRSGQGPG